MRNNINIFFKETEWMNFISTYIQLYGILIVVEIQAMDFFTNKITTYDSTRVCEPKWSNCISVCQDQQSESPANF